jgi:hypothetical protein
MADEQAEAIAALADALLSLDEWDWRPPLEPGPYWTEETDG